MALDPRFNLADPLQRLIPTSFKLIGHQPILGVGRVVLLLRSPSTVLRRLRVALKRCQDVIDLSCMIFVGDDRRFNGCWLHHTQDLPRNRLIDDQTGKLNAARISLIEPPSTAVIPKYVVMVTSVVHQQLMATAATMQQPGEQRRTRWAGPICSRRIPFSEMIPCRRSNSAQLT